MLEAVKSDGYALKWASKHLQNDKEIVLESVSNYSFSLIYASPELKNDRQIIIEALISEKKNNIKMIEDARIEDAKDIFDEVHHLARKYSIIELLSEEMKNDKELLLMAVESNGWVIDRLPKI